MSRVSKNISRHELACHCGCGFDSMDVETIKVVQDCCAHFEKELCCDKVVLIVNSASRCFGYNSSIGSNDNSQHPKARAIDFQIVGVSPQMIYSYLSEAHQNKYGIGLYQTFVHLDTRTDGPARW